MPTTYSYKVRDTAGRVVTGVLDAENSNLVANKLKDMGYVPISIEKKAASFNSEIPIPGLSKRVSQKEIALFSREFATLINAGVSLTRSLAILATQSTHKYFASVIDDVRGDVEAGSSLSQAMTRHPKQFGRLYLSMIRAGETGGNLDRTLEDLATTMEKQVELRRKIKSAMTYPIAVLVLVLLIMTAMLLFIVPVFKKMYKQLHGTLPTPTRILVEISNVVVNYFPFVLLGAVASLIALRRWVKTPQGRRVWDTYVLKVPVFGGLMRKTAMARFSSTFSTLLAAGVPILECLDITSDTCGNTLVADGVASLAEGARRGDPLARSLEPHEVFPPMVTQMISVGEETGSLDALLRKVAVFFEQEVEATVNALTSLLEPLMIVVLGGAVGGMVISLYLPMFDIYKLVGASG